MGTGRVGSEQQGDVCHRLDLLFDIEPIANPGLGQDVARPLQHLLELLAELAHVDA